MKKYPAQNPNPNLDPQDVSPKVARAMREGVCIGYRVVHPSAYTLTPRSWGDARSAKHRRVYGQSVLYKSRDIATAECAKFAAAMASSAARFAWRNGAETLEFV